MGRYIFVPGTNTLSFVVKRYWFIAGSIMLYRGNGMDANTIAAKE
jgi:hypothetical protein